MELKDLMLLIWRNIRYILLGLVVGAGIGFFVSEFQSPVYEATTKVFISRARQQGNADMLSLSDEQLFAINLQLAKSQPVLNEVSSQLGSKVDEDNVQISAIPNTLIIQIKVQDNDPQRAAMIANLLVQTLVQQNEILLSGRYVGFEGAITEQLGQVQKQIADLQSQISQINTADIQGQLAQVNQQIEQLKIEVSNLEQEIASFPNSPSPLERITLAEKQAQLDQLHSLMTLYQQIQTNLTFIGKPGQNEAGLENPQLVTLRSTLDIYQQINISLINSLGNVRLARTQSRQNVMQIVSAIPPKIPVRPMPALYLLLGSFVGLTLAAVIILLIDHLDDSFNSAGQVEKLLGIPVLGFIVERQSAENELVTTYDPDSTEAESFHALGASVEIVGSQKNIRTLMIVNAESENVRTTIAANLAAINARQGKRVILVDGDFKQPHLHRFFGVENQRGFAELLNEGSDVKSACHVVKGLEGLSLIPSGTVEKDSAIWLDSKKWEQLLIDLQEQADFVIVESPSIDSADAQILASKLDAVLLTIRPGRTRIDSAKAALRRFQLIGVKVTGAIFYRTDQSRKINKQFLISLKNKLGRKEKSGKNDGEIETSSVMSTTKSVDRSTN